MNATRDYTTVLTIAGSDGSGGAGIQADLKTIAAHSCYGLSVITAVTAQSTMGVADVHPIPSSFIAKQFETIVSDIRIDAIKIGMLGPAGNAETIAGLIAGLDGVPIVLDTVLRSSSGAALFSANDTAAMKRLFPLVSLITPNLPEATMLTGRNAPPSGGKEEIEQIALELQMQGAPSVLVKGGHWEGKVCHDCLLHEERFYWFSNPKINTVNTHGTGCTLSSAIAAGFAMKLGMSEAVARGIDYTRKALQAGAGWRLGHGHGPLYHFPDKTESRAD
ncbi:phosphomethylpyrimidine kinase [Chlorobaculum parvum NCIB 8327]|uniref:hydroxymethylpyrimidine kinase n=1 Tax=Chlorobaculum parvum (strain DSM 263 / NCIMB 8327) TaxID=517417 RepID=B3QNM3_CHLP8|nr:bifunctional hydroxymethylpyrimidine kinase/phosphomethylpyrimidine kinase [Chlorobaculum parvum]ACF11526.1 phosphomethylpyrimidine kinase [Chlorobaculum parvum NCIB 8327]